MIPNLLDLNYTIFIFIFNSYHVAINFGFSGQIYVFI